MPPELAKIIISATCCSLRGWQAVRPAGFGSAAVPGKKRPWQKFFTPLEKRLDKGGGVWYCIYKVSID